MGRLSEEQSSKALSIINAVLADVMRQFADVTSNPKKTHLDPQSTEEVATVKHGLMAHCPLSP